MDTNHDGRTVRLACCFCDTTDKDCITMEDLRRAEEEGWTAVGPAELGVSDSQWWNWLGICPACNAEGMGL
jgi:hypothetical protein